MPPALHMSAFDPKRTLRNLTSMSDRSAQKKAQENLGFKMLKLNRSSLRELAKCLGGARLDGLRGRKGNFLSQCCELLGLLGQLFELLA